MRTTYVGHACVLVEIDGFRVLTDPVLRSRIGPLRRVAPPPGPASIAGIDLLLVSHAHHDHLDFGSLRSLPDAPPALCPAPARGPLASAGLRSEALEPGDVVSRGPLSIEATPADHDGRRWPLVGSSEALGFVFRGQAPAISTPVGPLAPPWRSEPRLRSRSTGAPTRAC